MGFYATLVAATVIGLAIPYAPVNPIRALVLSAVLNGLVAAPLMALIMLLATTDALWAASCCPNR